jgi:hypothetical protein
MTRPTPVAAHFGSGEDRGGRFEEISVTHYLEFKANTGESVLVEVDAREITPPPGIEKAGLLKRGESPLARAGASFEQAIDTAVKSCASALVDAIEGLSAKPSDAEITFALKASGELGNMAIAKLGSEANFTVRLAWKT